jgi:hypothetical protein
LKAVFPEVGPLHVHGEEVAGPEAAHNLQEVLPGSVAGGVEGVLHPGGVLGEVGQALGEEVEVQPPQPGKEDL